MAKTFSFSGLAVISSVMKPSVATVSSQQTGAPFIKPLNTTSWRPRRDSGRDRRRNRACRSTCDGSGFPPAAPARGTSRGLLRAARSVRSACPSPGRWRHGTSPAATVRRDRLRSRRPRRRNRKRARPGLP